MGEAREGGTTHAGASTYVRMGKLKLFRVYLFALFVFLPSALSAEILIDGDHFVNEKGAIVLLRGFSIHSKMPPFRPVQKEEELDILKEAGVNLLRLHFSWEAAEPVQGQYDESYFEYYDKLVNWAWNRDIHVIIDFHNNAFSRYAAEGCGSGFPDWAMSSRVEKYKPKENGTCNFFRAMTKAIFFSEDNYKIWEDFLEDREGARGRFFALSERLGRPSADHEAVIGFDLNEPLPYDTKKKVVNYGLMTRFYEDWASVIQAEKSDAMIFVEPFATDHVRAGYTPQMQKPKVKNMVYAPHLYEPGTLMFGYPIKSYKGSLSSILSMREKWNVPLLIGEWGGRMYGHRAQQDMFDHLVRDFDLNEVSSVRWNYTPMWTSEKLDHYHDEDYSCFDHEKKWRKGCRPRMFVPVLSGEMKHLQMKHKGESMTYIPLLTGITGHFRSEETSMMLVWEHDPEQGETKIFANKKLLFPSGEVLLLTEGEGLYCSYDDRQYYVVCRSDQKGLKRVTLQQKDLKN
jgi:endoglycosylceramidase